MEIDDGSSSSVHAMEPEALAKATVNKGVK
jgi:hypothetical protein